VVSHCLLLLLDEVDSGTGASDRLVSLFLNLPFLLHRDTKSWKNVNLLLQRLSGLEQHHFVEAAERILVSAPAPAQTTQSGASFPSRRIIQLVQANCLSKATKLAESTIDTNGLAPYNNETLEALRELFPPRSNRDFLPAHHPNLQTIPINMALLDTEIRNLPTHSATGHSGWSYALIRQLFISELGTLEHRNTFKQRFLQLFRLLLQGRAGSSYLWCSSRVIPLLKPNNAIRPIAIGESFVRIAARLANRAVVPAIANFLSPTQFGIGVPGGTEIVAHLSNLLLRSNSGNPAYGIATLDISNAFNSIGRNCIWHSIRSHCPLLAPFFLWSYGTASPLFLSNGSLIGHSATGVRQGDPLGPLLFSLGLQPVLKTIQEEFPLHTILAYLDDITVLGPVEDFPTIVARIRTLLAALGLQLNLVKCKHWTVGDADGLTVLGVPVGTVPFQQDSLRSTFHDYTKVLDELVKLPATVAFVLLQSCIASRPMYYCRTVHPSFSGDNFVRFDDSIQHALLRILQSTAVNLLPTSNIIAGLPERLGGLGIRQLSSIHSQAWTASFLPAATYLTAHLRDLIPNLQLPPLQPFLETVQLVDPTLLQPNDVLDLQPPLNLAIWRLLPGNDDDDEDLLDLSNLPSQRSLVASVDERSCIAVCEQLADKPSELAWWLSARDKGIALWLHGATHQAPILRMDDATFRQCLRLRLLFSSLPPEPNAVFECQACREQQDPDADTAAFHGMLCCNHQRQKIARHNAVRDCLADFLRRVYGNDRVSLEQRVEAPNTAPVVVDIVLSTGQETYWLDVAIPHPSSRIYVQRNSHNIPLVAARHMESKKRDKYRPALQALGWNDSALVPFVIEATGRMGAAATAFLAKIKEDLAHRPHVADAPTRASNFFLQRISTLLGKFNAKMELSYIDSRLQLVA
jgi:hypothetical protein